MFHETASAVRAYIDASNKPDLFDGKCQYGFVVFWGGPLIFKSAKLEHVGMNSTYNEYQALTHTIKHIVWLRKLLHEIGLGHTCKHAVAVFGDNAQANNLCKEDLVTKGNMYFNVSYHYNKEQVKAGEVQVFYINTNLNVTDPMTKALPSIKSRFFRPLLSGMDSRVVDATACHDMRWDHLDIAK